MNHAEFDWDFENISHIARHNVSPDEAEEVLLADSLDLDQEFIEGEWRFKNLGSTRRGRFLVIVSTVRGERIRVITSFEPSAKLVREFLKSRSGHTE